MPFQCFSLYLLFTDCIKRTVKIETSTVEIEERGVKLRLTIVDTPGYGDGMDNKDRLDLKKLSIKFIYPHTCNVELAQWPND